MSAEVYANGMQVSGKAAPHQVAGSMPDVCLSPPSPPAGPIPIPYPNFAQASDTSGGSKTVFIDGKEISLKGSSNFKKSTGDEAATKSLGMGVVSHNIGGPVQHEAGSFDVKIEGCNAVRHLDLVTGNHSNATNGPTGPKAAKAKPGSATKSECEELSDNNKSVRTELKETTKDKRAIGSDGKGTGTTVSSMKCGGSVQAAHNSQTAYKRLPSRLAKGGSKAVRTGKKTPLCEASDYKHPAPAMQKSGHAEARLMATIQSSPPSNITLNIDWRPSSGGRSKMPCPDCHKMLCAAAKDCDHKIMLCGKDKQKKPLDCPKPKDKPGEAYSRLKKAVDGPPALQPVG